MSLSLNARLADLGPRLGSAAGPHRHRDDILVAWRNRFFLVWLVAALLVHFEWQRIVGGARLTARLGLGSAALIATAIAVRSQFRAGIVHPSGHGGMVGQLAGPGRRLWSGGGLIYAGALIIAVLTLRGSFPFGRWR